MTQGSPRNTYLSSTFISCVTLDLTGRELWYAALAALYIASAKALGVACVNVTVGMCCCECGFCGMLSWSALFNASLIDWTDACGMERGTGGTTGIGGATWGFRSA